MARYHGGTMVAGGYYLNPRRWSVEVVPSEGGRLGGSEGASYVKVAFPLLFLVVPPASLVRALRSRGDGARRRGADRAAPDS